MQIKGGVMKKWTSILCVMMLVSVTCFQPFQAKKVNAQKTKSDSNEIYQKTIQANLEELNLSIVNNDLRASKNNNTILKNSVLLNNVNSKSYDKNLSNFNELIKEKSIKDSLMNTLKSGRKSVAIAAKTVYEERKYDPKTKKETDRLLTEKEALGNQPTSRYNHTNRGQLTLTITVSRDTNTYTDYWVQAGGSWNVRLYSGANTEDLPGLGDDFIGVKWDNDFCTKSNASATGSYEDGNTFTPSVSDLEPRKYEIWAFKDDLNLLHTDIRASRVYAGVGVRNVGQIGRYTSFMASYAHTWSSATYSASFSGKNFGLSVNPTSCQWSLDTSVSGYF